MRTVNGVELPRVLAPAQARAMGLTRGRIRTELRRGNWQRLATGVLLTGADEPTRFDWAEVGIALAAPGAAVTGWEALRAPGFGGRWAPPDGPALVLNRRGMNRVVGGVRLPATKAPGWVAEVIDWLRARAAELGVTWPRSRGVLAPAAGEAPRALQVAGVRGAERVWQ